VAKIASEIVWFDVRSCSTGKMDTVMQRTSFRLERNGGHYTRTPLQTEFVGSTGKAFEKVSGNIVRCVESGEEFTVQAVSKRTTQK
jgi:hypothetical protein